MPWLYSWGPWGLLWLMELSGSLPPSSPWYTYFRHGKEENLSAPCFSSQTKNTSMEFIGHSFLGSLLVHPGKTIARALSKSSYFLLIYMLSICKEKVCKISLLKSSNMFPISLLMDEVEEEVLTKTWLLLLFFLATQEWIMNKMLMFP